MKHAQADDSQGRTRRDMLKRLMSTGFAATIGAGLADLTGVTSAHAATSEVPRIPASMILNSLPANAPAALTQALASGCCIKYTRDEGHCSPKCGSGWCCYHVVSSGCGLNMVTCINVSCAEGNFTSGC